MIGPALEMVTEDEARALRLAVVYALQQGLASDDFDQEVPDDRSLRSVAVKLGVRL